jgi:malonyl-CoA O-methyltransferase
MADPLHLPTREGYDLWSLLYDEEDNPLIALEERHFARLLGEPVGQRILDVGCGTGRHSVPLTADPAAPAGGACSFRGRALPLPDAIQD